MCPPRRSGADWHQEQLSAAFIPTPDRSQHHHMVGEPAAPGRDTSGICRWRASPCIDVCSLSAIWPNDYFQQSSSKRTDVSITIWQEWRVVKVKARIGFLSQPSNILTQILYLRYICYFGDILQLCTKIPPDSQDKVHLLWCMFFVMYLC